MKKSQSNIILVSALVLVSAILYIAQIFIFHKPDLTGFYIFQDLAFLPLQVAIATLFLDNLISAREKKERLKKMNMAINTFFGEMGTDAILMFREFAVDDEELKETLNITARWNNSDFDKARKAVSIYDFKMDSRKHDLVELKSFLCTKRYFLLSMLENSNLLEHDIFTDMLWAIFHMMDELVARTDFTQLPEHDLDHLSVDIKRAYLTLLVEWIYYLQHLKTDYPYLFSLALRQNPFDDNRSAIIK